MRLVTVPILRISVILKTSMNRPGFVPGLGRTLRIITTVAFNISYPLSILFWVVGSLVSFRTAWLVTVSFAGVDDSVFCFCFASAHSRYFHLGTTG